MKRALFIGWLVLAGCGGKKTQAEYVTSPVTRGNVVARVTASGTLSSLVTVQVGTQVSGRIVELHADFNSQVKKGQVLAKLDPQLILANIEQASANERAAVANVDKAKATAKQAERDLNRTTDLAKKEFVSQADLDISQSAYDVALAGIEAANAALAQSRATLKQAKLNLEYTTVESPIDGTVISRSVDVGQTVQASMTAPVLFTIAQDLKRMQVDTSVAEADVGKLKEGLEAGFTVDAFPNKRFVGTVRQIRYAATVVSNVVTYDAVIDVENPELLLRPGMTANVTFVTAEADDVLKIPNAALRFRLAEPAQKMDGIGPPPKGTRMVTVLRDGKPERVAVQTGVTDGSSTEVVSGLDVNDIVITDKVGAPGSGGGGPAGGRPPGMGRMF